MRIISWYYCIEILLLSVTLPEIVLASKVKIDTEVKVVTDPEQIKINTTPLHKNKCVNKLSNDTIFNNDIVIGNKNAKVLFIEYFAPTCSHCAKYHLKIFPEIKRKFIDTNRIAYVMRECVGNKQDLDEAILARCRNDNASYVTLMDQILSTQTNWAYDDDYRASLTALANEYGISASEYNSCLEDHRNVNILFDHLKLIASDTDFLGTPSFYINGQLFRGKHDVETLVGAIEAQLEIAEQTKR
jgi:protein-disulfide isomerase